MTVADIKEYIDEVENKYLRAELIPIFTNANLEEIITNLRSMLDELPRDYAQETINDMEKVLDNAWKKVLGSDNK